MSFRPFQRAFNQVLGRGEAAVTIPAMDGALRPNSRLEQSDRLLEAEEPDNLVALGRQAFFSSGSAIFTLDLDAPRPRAERVHSFPSKVSALALAADGAMAVGLADGRIVFPMGPAKRPDIARLGNAPLKCPTALHFADPDRLFVCIGSARHSPDQWQHSLMNRDQTGSVWRINLGTGQSERLAGDMAYPYGVMIDDASAIVVSEAWRHRLVRVDGAKTSPKVVLGNLPGYPSRHVRAPDGGSWLAIVAPRSQLVELVLREPRFRAAMMAEIDDPSLWVAPSLSSRRSFLEPMQGGALKQMGILKPWSPTRSYGLVVRLDAEFQPLESFHSRSDGRHHGIRSCIERNGALLSTSGGGDAILRTSL
jgi:sugar lactone lactonase YvrE